MTMWWSAVIALLAAGATAQDNVTVVRLSLPLEQEHTLQVDSSLEYILQFLPTAEQSQYPSRVWVRSGGGEPARPLLVTARQQAGAITWQLPYYSGDTLLYELERTLCPAGSGDSQPSGGCAEDDESNTRSGEFTLHLGSSCAAPFSVSLRVGVVREWRVGHLAPLDVTVSLAAPRVHYYNFPAEEESVRLVLESQDDVCVAVAVQAYTCPIAETLSDIQITTLRMTMLRSGAAQISKKRYPNGFYIIVVMYETDEPCTGDPPADSDWLWEAAVWPDTHTQHARNAQRVKHLTIEMKPSLSRSQYVSGTLVTLGVFLLFYISLGALVCAERWPRWHRLVAPTAVLAHKPDPSELESATDTAAARRRRDSAATFDSSDNSDESDSDEEFPTSATATTAATPPLTTPVTPSFPTPVTPPLPTPATPPAGAVNDVPPTAAHFGSNGRAETGQEHLDSITRADVLDGDGEATQRQEGEAGEAEARARPFGLPARLRVAALSRRRARVLVARSDRYLYTLCTVAVFYALPVVQFVAAFQAVLIVSGSLDLCYYNFLCAHPLGALSDFNHVFSNLGYLLLGALFMLQVRRRRRRRDLQPRDEEYGIPQHYGLLSSLGACMMMVAVLSASYHVCPNGLNFQFDTAFMYVLAVLLMVKIYQSRHPDINARAHATFGVLAVLIALVVWGVLGGGPLYWSVFTVLHVFTFLLLSLRIYYLGQFRLGKQSLAQTARAVARGGARPLYSARLAALVLANAVNWGFAIYGLVTQSSDIASHLLFVLLGNALVYVVFYLSMKLAHGERPRWYAWLHLAAAAAAWLPALYYFTRGATQWAATAARSRHYNHECRLLAFYDSHDLWHLLSAAALYFTFNAVLTWDDGLAAVKRTDIAVF